MRGVSAQRPVRSARAVPSAELALRCRSFARLPRGAIVQERAQAPTASAAHLATTASPAPCNPRRASRESMVTSRDWRARPVRVRAMPGTTARLAARAPRRSHVLLALSTGWRGRVTRVLADLAALGCTAARRACGRSRASLNLRRLGRVRDRRASAFAKRAGISQSSMAPHSASTARVTVQSAMRLASQ